MREGESIRFFRRTFLYHIAQNFRRGNLLVVRSFWVSKNLCCERGEYQDFPLIFFVSQCGKLKFVGGPFSVSEVSVIQNKLCFRG